MITLDVHCEDKIDTVRGTATFWEITRVKEEDNLLILIVHIKHSDPEGVLPIGETKED